MSGHVKQKSDAKLKRCILESAAKLFSTLGLDKTSTRDISKDSQANISLISYHFGGKEGLYREVIKEFALKVQEQVSPQIAEFRNQSMNRELFIKEINQMVNNMVEMRLAHSEISMILSREKIEGMPLSRDVHEEIFYPLIKNFIEMFSEAQKKGFVKKDVNPALFFILLSEGVWGFYEIMNCNTLLSKDCSTLTQDKEALKKQVAEVFLTGVLV
jgi:AcrR family transcriptional regulator